ncbi:MAG: hypothetical protein OCD02_03335 [Spirochaetaceae bacterium]
MGKLVSIIIIIVLQLGMILAGHIYFTQNPKEVAVVVETSYGLTTHRNDIVKEIEILKEDSRYKNFHYGTDKTYLGKDANLDSLFRVSFGTMDVSRLDKLYPKGDYDLRYLLSFTDIKAKNWNIIKIEK